MKNFEKVTLTELKGKVISFYNIINDADGWVNKNIDSDRGQHTSILLKNKRRIVRKISNSIDSKPVFALFGASQVGKSYLVKNILSVSGAPLEIKLGDKTIDFLKDINPPGTGAESTGVVTRFTIDIESDSVDFPVRSKLLNIKDIILIVCDSFFSDLKTIEDYPTAEDFKLFSMELGLRYGNISPIQEVLVEDDIFDIKDYFDKNFYKFSYYTKNINDSNYWFDVGKIIPFIPISNWVDVFSILWNNNSSYSDLFRVLIAELQKVNFASELFLGANSVIRGHGEILDVQRLKEIFVESEMTVVKDINDQVFEMNISLLSALSAEITLPCDSKLSDEKPFLKDTDLLDFPGSRSRLEHTMASVTLDAIPDLYLRGKVSYLFNKYSGDFEINNLLFCQNDKQLDVNELPALLNDWIRTNVGADASDREKNIASLPISPLFVIFTFFNNQLKFDTTNDDRQEIDYKWDTRFNRFFEQELVTLNHNWHTKWTVTTPAFNNFFLLRDYKYSADTFSGFEDNGTEDGIQKNRIEFLDQLRKSFLKHDFVNKHFENKEYAFDSAALPNQDGSQRIIDQLEPAANNYIKVQNYVTQLRNIKEELIPIISKYYYSDDLEQIRKKAISDSLKVQLEMNRVFSVNHEKFNQFISSFMLNEVDVYNHLHENLVYNFVDEGNTTEYELFKSGFPDLNDSYTQDENLEVIRDSLGFSNVDEVINLLSEQGIDIDKLFVKKEKSTVDSILDGILDIWIEQIKPDNMSDFTQSGLSTHSLQIVTEAYQKAFAQSDFKLFLTKIIKEKYQGIVLDKSTEEYLAAVICQYFNEFIGEFGVNQLDVDLLKNVQNLQPQLSAVIETLINVKKTPNIASLVDIFNKQSEDSQSKLTSNSLFEGYNTYLYKLKISMLSNCGFVNYDIHENNKLEGIISSAGDCDFNLIN